VQVVEKPQQLLEWDTEGSGQSLGLQHPAHQHLPAGWLEGAESRQASAEGTQVLGICTQQPQALLSAFPGK
jgi:hypothetical protein